MSDEELNVKKEELGGKEGIIFAKGQRILELFEVDDGHINAMEALMVVEKVHSYLVQRITEQKGRGFMLMRLLEKMEAMHDHEAEGHSCEECDNFSCDKKIDSIIKGE